MSENSQINGNLFIGCARLSIGGPLNGNLYAGAAELIINNEIKGDVSFKGRRIIFGEKGKINGNLSYSTRERISKKDPKGVGIPNLRSSGQVNLTASPYAITIQTNDITSGS